MTLLLELYVHTLELSAELSAGGPDSVGPVGPDFADIEFISSYPPAQFAGSASECALARTTAGRLELGTRGAPPLFSFRQKYKQNLFL